MKPAKLLFLSGLGSLLGGSVLSHVTYKLILELAPKLLKAGLGGKDLNKGTSWMVPEDGGLGPSAIFLLVISLISVIPRFPSFAITAAFSIMASSFLGFVDDIVDLRWRYKLIVPTLTLLPLVNTYGGRGLNLGFYVLPLSLTKMYCLLFAIFSQNAVNIYAGINGLEVGQSLLACIFLLIIVYHKLYMALVISSGANVISPMHLFSAEPHLVCAVIVLTCFIFVSYPLYLLNRYPSKVFVGDIYAYFAGSTFAASCIMSDSLILGPLLFIPQIINFFLSTPPLFGIVPCPRHRLPRFSKEDNKLTGIPTNLNLLNQYLRLRGPLPERRLCCELLLLQFLISIIVLIGYFLSFDKLYIAFAGRRRTL